MKALASTPSSASRATPSRAPAAGFASTSAPGVGVDREEGVADAVDGGHHRPAIAARRAARAARAAGRAQRVAEALEQRRERLAHGGAALARDLGRGLRPRGQQREHAPLVRAQAVEGGLGGAPALQRRGGKRAEATQHLGLGGAGLGPCGAELVRHHLLDLLPPRDEPGGELGLCATRRQSNRSPAAGDQLDARRCR